MEIDQLRNFLKVAELRNFTHAAEAVNLSQSALSRSIARLEHELGQPLFQRQARSVELTDAGTLLKNRAEQILGLVDDVKAEICDDGETGRLRIGAIPTIAPYFLPGCLKGFQKRHSRAQVIVQEETTELLLKKLHEGTVDLLIAALPVDEKYLTVEPLFQEELLLVMSADHLLADKKTIRMDDLDHLPFILLGETHCLSDAVISFCRQRSFHPIAVERTSQLATVQELVALNHGISFVPRMAQVLDSSRRRIYRSVTGATPSRTICVVFNPYRYQSQLMGNFLNHVRDHVHAID